MISLLSNLLIIPIGMMIGILVSAPVGPVNVLCIQRAIERGFWGGVAAGMGAMLGDGLIALFAALGVNAISGTIIHYRTSIQLIGGLAIIVFGARLFFTDPPLDTDPALQGKETLVDFIWDIPQTFFLTITNPGAVLGLFAIFGGVGMFVEGSTYIDAFIMVAAVMGGSFVWWVGLSHFIGRIRHRINKTRLRQVNQVAGMVLLVLGGLMLAEVAWKYLPMILDRG